MHHQLVFFPSRSILRQTYRVPCFFQRKTWHLHVLHRGFLPTMQRLHLVRAGCTGLEAETTLAMTFAPRIQGDHPGRLTWTIMMDVWKIIFLSKWVICRFHVNLPGCLFLLTFASCWSSFVLACGRVTFFFVLGWLKCKKNLRKNLCFPGDEAIYRAYPGIT